MKKLVMFVAIVAAIVLMFSACVVKPDEEPVTREQAFLANIIINEDGSVAEVQGFRKDRFAYTYTLSVGWNPEDLFEVYPIKEHYTDVVTVDIPELPGMVTITVRPQIADQDQVITTYYRIHVFQ